MIEVQSQLGQGNEFSFTIEVPLAQDWLQKQVIETFDRRIIGDKGKPRTILMVDDRWENRPVLTNLTELIGFNTVEAHNGREALVKP